MQTKQKLFRDMTSKQQIDTVVRGLKAEIQKRRAVSRATLKDIRVMLLDKMDAEGYDRTYTTKLYRENGGEYCELVSILSEYETKGIIDEMRVRRRKEEGRSEPEKYWGIHYITTTSEGVLIHESKAFTERVYRELEDMNLSRGLDREKREKLGIKIAPFFKWGGIDTKDMKRGEFLRDYKGKYVEMIDGKPLYIDI